MKAMVILVAGAIIAVTGGEASGRQPYELVRELQRLQDQAAAGDANAPQAQARVLGELADALAPSRFEATDDPRNARAAVIFALSGGDPAAMGNLEDVIEPAVIDPTLVKAAKSYASGRLERAREWLAAVDDGMLPPAVAGQVALSRGILGGDDPAIAKRFLDEARLLMPGTLVEEVALRRGALLAATSANRAAFEALARRYLERFSASVYAPMFRDQIVEAVVMLQYGGGPAWLAALDETLSAAPVADRQYLWLEITRHALPRGELVLARHAAQRTIEIAGDESAGGRAARAHLAAVRLVTGDYEAARNDLEELSRTELEVTDRRVLETALGIANALRRWPAPAAAAAQQTAPETDPDESRLVPDIIARVESSLAVPDEPVEATP